MRARGLAVVACALGAACGFREGGGAGLSDAVSAHDAHTASDGARSHDALSSPPALVQQTTATENNTTGLNMMLTATLPASPGAGDLLVFVGAAEAGELPANALSGGGVATWARATFSSANANIEIWYGITNGTSRTVTANYGAPSTNPLMMNVSEWSHIATNGPLDAANDNNGAAGTASVSLSNVAAAGELVVFGFATHLPATAGGPGPGTWSALQTVASNVTQQWAWYTLAPAPGDMTTQVTQNGTGWDAAIAAFKSAL